MIDRHKNNAAFFLWPNCIEYLRIVLVMAGAWQAMRRPWLAFMLLFVAGVLDAVDGYLARRLQQESALGVALDYAVDRATTVVLAIMWVVCYPAWWQAAALILAIDILSHVLQLYLTAYRKEGSHKVLGGQQTGFIGVYYTRRSVLFAACASYDLCIGLSYLYALVQSQWVLVLCLCCLPGFLYKLAVHLVQISSSSQQLARI